MAELARSADGMTMGSVTTGGKRITRLGARHGTKPPAPTEQSGITSYAQAGVGEKLGLAVGRDCGITGTVKAKR